MTSSCLLGVHHAMFAKTAGNEIKAIGSWDEVKWLAASGWRRRLGKRKSSQLDRAPFVTWSPTRGTWSDWKSSRNFFLETFFGKLMRWNAALPTPPSPSISWPGNHDPLNNIPSLLLPSSSAPLLIGFFVCEATKENCPSLYAVAQVTFRPIAESHFSSEDFEHYWVYGFCSYLPGLVTVWIAPVGCW